MSRNRYVGDYRIVESIDARGRVKSDYEYIGAPYVYAGDATAVKAARSRVALCCAVGWAAWLSALIPISSAMRALYVALPFAFAAIPLALTAGTAVSLFREKDATLTGWKTVPRPVPSSWRCWGSLPSSARP